MKRIIFAITVAATLLCACGNSTAPEERGQDERLITTWESVTTPMLQIGAYYRNSNGTGAIDFYFVSRVTTYNAYIAREWYTQSGRLYLDNIVFTTGPTTLRCATIGNGLSCPAVASFQYSIVRDTLTLSDAQPDTGSLVAFAGKYILWTPPPRS